MICEAPSVQTPIDSQWLVTAVYNLLLLNNGDGVPDSIRNMLFHRSRVPRKTGGIGLRLTIAEQAAREDGGRLNLEESIPGKTVFVLRLPKLALAPLTVEHSE